MGSMPGPGPEPPLGDLLQIAMEIPEVSRLPLRDDQEQSGEYCKHVEASYAIVTRARLEAIGYWGSSFVRRHR